MTMIAGKLPRPDMTVKEQAIDALENIALPVSGTVFARGSSASGLKFDANRLAAASAVALICVAMASARCLDSASPPAPATAYHL